MTDHITPNENTPNDNYAPFPTPEPQPQPTPTKPLDPLDEPMTVTVIDGNGMHKRPVTVRDFNFRVIAEAREKMKEMGPLYHEDAPVNVWLDRYRAQHKKCIRPLGFETGDGGTEWFYVLRLCDADIIEMGVLMSRQGYSLWQIEDVESERAFATALLTVGVCRGKEDEARLFGCYEEAEEFLHTRGDAAHVSSSLRAALVALNPTVVKKKPLARESPPVGSAPAS